MDSDNKSAALRGSESGSRQAQVIEGPSSARLQEYAQRDPSMGTDPTSRWSGGLVPMWLLKSIDLVGRREAGEVLTDELVESECQSAGLDPVPVMLLVQLKKPRPWGAVLVGPNGPNGVVGQRLIGHWYDFCDRHSTIIDTPGGKAALKLLLEITGLRAPRQYDHPPRPSAIHEYEIPRGGSDPFFKKLAAKRRKQEAARRKRGTW
jgi:hypothetical protein